MCRAAHTPSPSHPPGHRSLCGGMLCVVDVLQYPLSPPLPGIPGHEGVMRVVEAGEGATGFSPGDLAVPLESSQGTWRQQGVFPASAWFRLPAELPLAAAATLCIKCVGF